KRRNESSGSKPWGPALDDRSVRSWLKADGLRLTADAESFVLPLEAALLTTAFFLPQLDVRPKKTLKMALTAAAGLLPVTPAVMQRIPKASQFTIRREMIWAKC